MKLPGVPKIPCIFKDQLRAIREPFRRKVANEMNREVNESLGPFPSIQMFSIPDEAIKSTSLLPNYHLQHQ